jgi:DNA-binding IclR family transcriptional regulator
VYDFRGKVVGAIGISGPAGRMSLDHIADFASIVMQASQALSDRMSFKRA